MISSTFIRILIILCLGLVIFLYLREPSLPKNLAGVKCVSEERQSHARVAYGKAKVFHLCLSGKYWDIPKEETCHIYNGATVCEKENGIIALTRTIGGVVYAARYQQLEQMNILSKEPTSNPTATYESEFFTNFSDQAIKAGGHGDFNETEYVFLLRDVKDYLPPDFTLIKGAVCDKRASVLNHGYCFLDAKTNSLYWRIIFTIRKKAGTEITESDYQHEFVFWRPYLTELVKDQRM